MNDPARASAGDVRKIQRQNLVVTIVGFSFIIILAAVAGVYFGPKITGTKAGVDFQSATNARSACLTERRSAQDAARTDLDEAQTVVGALMNPAALPADVYAQLAQVYGADFTLQVQYARAISAIKAGQAAKHALEPQVVNQPPPVGCGPPITSTKETP